MKNGRLHHGSTIFKKNSAIAIANLFYLYILNLFLLQVYLCSESFSFTACGSSIFWSYNYF